jgi:transcriptional regulator with XRE-family HTH domain
MVPVPRDDQFLTQEKKPGASPAVRINGSRLQALRKQAGLTQEELASRAGYSDRLIRKAEASSVLRQLTVVKLAAALSTNEYTVSAADLTISPELMSVEILKFLLGGQPSAIDSLKDYTHPAVVLHVAGLEIGVPFAGSYTSLAAFPQFSERLLSWLAFVRLSLESVACYASPFEVCLHAITEIGSLSGDHSSEAGSKVWWFLKVKFESNLISGLELMYDTGNICRLLGLFPG